MWLMLNIMCFITFLHLVSYLMENFGLIEENAIEQESKQTLRVRLMFDDSLMYSIYYIIIFSYSCP